MKMLSRKRVNHLFFPTTTIKVWERTLELKPEYEDGSLLMNYQFFMVRWPMRARINHMHTQNESTFFWRSTAKEQFGGVAWENSN